ncbi:MAG: c-type cytochrome [Magnetococcales bacterium]|nr:c-type cytochrome [Magnetococcales bacterium]
MKYAQRIMACLATALLPSPVNAADLPADTYFSLAVTENSHNHYGENLLFLDFQERADPARITPQVVIAPRVPEESIQVNGDLQEWDPRHFTQFSGRVMNNYPLSEYHDARPGAIRVAAAFDAQYVYFAVDFEDANHDPSIYRKQWIHTQGTWQTMPHRPLDPTRPAPVNAADQLAGQESEDRVLFMFPIVDQQHTFRDGGLGCGAYCHPNLKGAHDPAQTLIGEEVSQMHTVLPDDRADVWHWTATRSNPAHTTEDAHIVHAMENENGFKEDPGQSPDLDNNEKKLQLSKINQPAYVNREDFLAGRYNQAGFISSPITLENRLRITREMTFAEGVTLPNSILRPATGSRSDVTAFGRFDAETHHWTIEFKRRRDTGDPLDHAFVPGVDAAFPTTPPVKPGNAQRGQTLYQEKACASCHGENGEGKFTNGYWLVPRNQRASGTLIAKTAHIHRPERLHALSYQLVNSQTPPPVMSFVPLTRQEAEDIGAWLQTRFTPRGQ